MSRETRSRETRSDELHDPAGPPMDEGGADEGEETEREGEEVEGIDERISDDPSYGEDEAEYDPATQAPKEAER